MTQQPDNAMASPGQPKPGRIEVMETPRPRTGMRQGLLVLIAGVAIIFVAAVWDIASFMDKPWNTALILFEIPDQLPETPSYPVQVRRVSRPEPLDSDLTLRLLRRITGWERFDHHIDLNEPELVISVDLCAQTLQPLLASGRLPEPGQPEVLAGPLARDAVFFLDDVSFHVVGRLQDTVSGFLFAYMLPDAHTFEMLFSEERGGAEGLLVVAGETLIFEGLLPDRVRFPVPEGPALIEAGEDADKPSAPTDTDAEEEEAPVLTLPPFTGGIMPAPMPVVYLAAFGLVLVSLGSAMFHFGLFKRMHGSVRGLLFPVLDEIMRRPGLFWAMHIFLYGAFFFSMRAAIANPLLTWRITQYIEAVFTHGGLSYVGEAYASGNVPRAAWATFYNNYIEQTLGLTFLISLFPIPLGIIKTLLSFMLVGGAMAPMWVGASQGYVLHSITMALELEAYIVACFAVAAWTLYVVEGWRNRSFRRNLKTGLLMLVSAMMLTGIMLAVAALYEAFTLIHLV